MKIYICSHLPAVSEKTAVLLHLEELVGQKKPPQADGVLELYNDAFENVLESDGDWARVIGELRWQSVKANPKNEDLSLKSFQTCMEKDDLDHARQVSQTPSRLLFVMDSSSDSIDRLPTVWRRASLVTEIIYSGTFP